MSIGVGLATGLYGISFGALSSAAGLSLWQTQVLSLAMFSGGSQFALVGVIAASGPAGMIPAIISAWLLGIRNGFYALRLNGVLGVPRALKAISAQLTIDESTAMGLAQDEEAFEGRASRLAFWATGLSVYLLWNLATFIGAVSVSAIGDPKSFGLDAAIAAGLFALVWPQIKSRTDLSVAFGGALIALALTPVVPPGVPVLAAAIVAIIVGWVTGRKLS